MRSATCAAIRHRNRNEKPPNGARGLPYGQLPFSKYAGGTESEVLVLEHKPYSYTSADEFLADAARLERGLPYAEDTSVLGAPLAVNGKSMKNRLLAQPIEGFDAQADGSPNEQVIARYRRLAQGGSGAIWMESISVSYEGKSGAKQLWITKDNASRFAELVQTIHKNGCPYVVAQLTHSGRYSNPDGKSPAVCAFENPLIPKENSRIISDDELDRLREDYITAAVLAEQAGFDAVDIRACHGYLLNELFAAYHRPGRYGGSYENRTRLLRDIVAEVKRQTKLTVCVRLNVTDGLPYPYGWGCDREDVKKQDLSEPLRLVQELEALGVSIINVSAGIGAYAPYMIRPYDRGAAIPDEHPLEGVERLLQSARMVKQAAPSVCVVASGFTWLRAFAPMVAAGGVKESWFDLAGFGRQWVADPDYANEILAGKPLKKPCATCGGCTALIKTGKKMRCVRK